MNRTLALWAGPAAQWRPSAAVRTEAPSKEVSSKINVSLKKNLLYDAFFLFNFFPQHKKIILTSGYIVCSLLLPNESQGQHKNVMSKALPNQCSSLGESRKVSLSGGRGLSF